jgi:hypothetical protein
MQNTILSKYDNFELIEKRISLLIGARLRNKDRIKKAIEKQNEIRNKHKAPPGWESVSQIRKWREAH